MKPRLFTRLVCLGSCIVPFIPGCESASKVDSLRPKTVGIQKTRCEKAQAKAFASKTHEEFKTVKDSKMGGNEQIAMLLYPKFKAFDLVGPQFLFASLMFT